jgi:hypothetical protein
LPQERLKRTGSSGAIFGTSLAKTQHAGSAGRPVFRQTFARLSVRESDLFDRDGEPRDQPRDLVQMVRIVRFDCLGKPDEALVVTQRGDVAWHDGRHWFHQNGQVWHGITSGNPALPSFAGE